LKSEIVKNRRLFSVLELFSPGSKKVRPLRLTYYRYVIYANLSSILYTIWEEIDFAVLNRCLCKYIVTFGEDVNKHIKCTIS
jgi:hypothetical protein